MFASYFDDAGTHDGSRVMVFAGYIGTVGEWELLENEWNTFLERESISFYHSVDCAHARGPFEGRSKGAREQAHRVAVETITRRKLVPLGVGIDVKSYRRLPSTPREEVESCFQRIVIHVGQYMEAYAPADQTAFVLEEMPGMMGRLVGQYELLMEAHPTARLKRYFTGTPVFQSKIGSPQLQVADVLAYEMRLGSDRHFFPTGLNPRRGAWEALSRHSDAHGGKLLHLEF